MHGNRNFFDNLRQKLLILTEVYEKLLIETTTSDHGIANRWCLLPLIYNDRLENFDHACLIVDSFSVAHKDFQSAYDRENWMKEPASRPQSWTMAGLKDDTMKHPIWDSMKLELNFL